MKENNVKYIKLIALNKNFKKLDLNELLIKILEINA